MFSSTGNALAQVKSNAFNVTLKLLLKNNTPVINIQQAADNFSRYVFLDARAYKEFAVSHIRNATYIGDKGVDLKAVAAIPKSQAIIVYCSIGKRSEDIAVALKKEGYAHVKNLYGGIFEWVNQGHPVYNIKQIKTDSVHAYSRFWGQWLDRGVKVYD